MLDQDTLLNLLLPVFEGANARYEKATPVFARQAKEGERIVTITSSGVETENVANSGDYVVKSQTEAAEEYIISEEGFTQRYRFLRPDTGEWSEYLPVGEILAIVVDDSLLKLLNSEDAFEILASWGHPQKVRKGDILATPLPDNKEVYRIDRREFEQTYRKSDKQ